jgi:AcrR family transcriptional regulator
VATKDEQAQRGDGEELRERIIAAGEKLIAEGGAEAATTRAVAAAAGVQAPAIYRLFGDKQGLLAAVVESALRRYLAEKATRRPHADSLQDLRDGWDAHVAFGLANPDLFAIMNSQLRPAVWHAMAEEGTAFLRQRIQRLASDGRLRVAEDHAVGLMRAMGIGFVLTLLQRPEAERDLRLSQAAFEAVVAAITGRAELPANSPTKAKATALRASLDQTGVLTGGERLLLEELLDRIAAE